LLIYLDLIYILVKCGTEMAEFIEILCNNFDRSFGDWNSRKEFKKKQFEQIVEKIKKLNSEYDCLIPLSGGKDSTYALYVCDKIYNMKCLCITFDNGFL